MGETEQELREKAQEKEKIEKQKESVNVEGHDLTGISGKVLGLLCQKKKKFETLSGDVHIHG